MRRLSTLLFAAFLIAAALGLRWHRLDRPIWNLDEGSTFTMAQQVVEGQVLYRDAADNRSPLLPYLKAAVFFVAGDWNAYAVHLLLALGMGFGAIMLWRLARQLGDETAGITAAVVFTVLGYTLLDPSDAIAANTGWFLVLFSISGYALFARNIQRPGFLNGLPMGLMFGASFLCKQPGLFDFFVVWILIAFRAIAAPDERRALLRFWLGGAVGAAAPVLAFIVYFAAHDAIPDLVYYAYTFNTRIYIPEVPQSERLAAMIAPFDLAWRHTPAAFAFGIAGAIVALVSVFRALRQSPAAFPLLPWLALGASAAGILATGLSGRTFSHYSAQVAPGLSLACGWCVSQLLQLTRSHARRHAHWAVVAALIVAAVGLARDCWRRAGELQPQDLFPLRIGHTIAAHTKPSDHLFVWGYYPELYFFSERLPATRFIYTNYVTGMIAWTNLDPFVDTAYGISPGAWTQLAADLDRRPPAMIVDTSGSRSYSKFPLHDQPLLWDLIQREFAQVAVRSPVTHGMRLFKRLTPIPDSAKLPAAVFDPKVVLSGVHEYRRNEPPRLQVLAPAGASRVEVYAGDRLVAQLDHPVGEDVEVIFFVDPSLPETAQLRAILSYPDRHAISAPFDFRQFAVSTLARPIQGPRLTLKDIAIAPSAADLALGELARSDEQPDTWRMDTPETLEYPLPANLRSVSFVHGPYSASRGLSDGYDLVVDLVDEANHRTELHRHRLQPRTLAADQVPQHVTLSLPAAHAGGRLIFRFLPGPQSNPDYDWIYFGQLRGETHGPAIRIGSDVLLPAAGASGKEPLKTNLNGTWLAHAPARVEWPRPLHLSALNIHYGIEEGAYTAPNGHTDGVAFILELIDEQQQVHPLFSRTLTPFNHPEHRGEQTTRVELPPKLSGTLILRTDAGPNNDASWDWAWIGALQAEGYGPPIVISPTRELLPISSYTVDPNGDPSKRNGPADWGAHADAQLVYNRPLDLTRVTFRYGLADGAGRDESGQQRSDGAEMIVSFAPSSGGPAVELFRRTLDPFHNPSDLGEQISSIDLPPFESGRLFFRLSPGPHNNNAFDWGFWGRFDGESLRSDEHPPADSAPPPGP